MKQAYQKKLLSILMENDVISSTQIGQRLEISYKTSQQLCRSLSAELQPHGAVIISKKGEGYHLEITDNQKFQTYLNNQQNGFVPVYPKDRINYLIWSLIQNRYVKVSDIAEKIYVSASTVLSDLKEAEEIITSHDLSLHRKPHYGTIIIGSEYNKRMCLAECIRDGSYYDYDDLLASDENRTVVSTVLKECLEHNNVRISAIAFNELSNHIMIQIDRIRKGNLIEEDFRDSSDEKLRKLAEEIALRISEETGISIPEKEIDYLTLLLRAKETVVSDKQGNVLLDSSVMDIANEMIDSVYDAFDIDFRNDFDLKMTLCQHLIPLRIRIENGISSGNPILDDIRREYPLSNVMASHAAKVINERYKNNLSEEEIGYIALTFALAMEKQKTKGHRKNICIVSSYGRINSRLLEFQIINNLKEYIGEVHSIDYTELDTFDFSNTDYVFSTVPINQEIPVPIVQMSSLNSEQQVEFIKKIFKKNEQNEVLNVFSDKLFIVENETDKQKIIRNMCDRIDQVEHIEGLYEAVIRREEAGHTVFCNNVALSHPDIAMAKKATICVSVLNKPVEWEEGKNVEVIFLVCIAKNASDNLAEMYQSLSRIVTNKNYIERLIHDPEFRTLENIINEINLNL